MKKLLVASVVACLTGAVNAQSAFEGAYGQIGIGYENNTMSKLSSPYTVSSGANGTGTNSAANQTASGMPLVLGLGYTFAVSGPWLVGIGADYSALSQKTGTYTSTNTSATLGNGTSTGNQMEVSNRYNIYITPSYAIDKDKLAYIKAGYSSQQVKFTAPAQGTDPAISSTTNFTGYILGLGYKQIISGGFYGFAEGNYMSYGTKTNNVSWRATNNGYTTSLNQTGSANAYTFLVGVGYKF
jgi:outer membrane immunogenic protein